MLEPTEHDGTPPESLGVEPGRVYNGPRDLGLTTNWVAKRFHYKKSVGSTSSVLKALAG